MKKIYSTAILALSAISLSAQGPHAAKLYGMTQYGGTDHRGTIFHYTPSAHAINVDYEFKVKVKGATPKSGIVTGNNGKYYGTTTAGGSNNAGVIFQWDSVTSVYTELYNFTAGSGMDARGSMVLYNGKFYGMTNAGGAHNFGVIYEWDPVTNVYTDKIDMDSINGKNPDGSLTLVGSRFYGFTRNGGINNKGVLFEWDPATNIYLKKYDFSTASGANPVGKLSLSGGKFYAMTNMGGVNDKGVIYEWDYTTNVYTKKMDFNGTNGAYPLGYLTLYSGKFYGLTYEGGIYETALVTDHYGVLFEWNPATNVYVKKRDLGATAFGQQSTHGPIGSLTLRGNELWGSTTEGLMKGAIFCWNISTGAWSDYFINHRINPPYNHLQNEDYFQAPGNNAYEALLLSGNKLLGTSSAAGANEVGCIYEYDPDSLRITRAVHMKAADGVYPKGSLSRIGNKLYGLTFLGGENHFGNIFEWDMSTNQFTERVQFDGYTTGACPWSDLQYYNGKFYGTTQYGRAKSNFVWNAWSNRHYNDIFSWDPVTNDYEVLLENSPASRVPFTLHDDLLYSLGGNGGHGSIMTYDPATNIARDSAFFNGTNGDFVMFQDFLSSNKLVYYNGKYYGMTPSVNIPAGKFKGGIYEWDPVTNVITGKIVFNDTTGYAPQGGLTLVGNVFYGLTSNLPTGFGTLFKWDPATNVFEKKSDLGYAPVGGGAIISPRGTLTYSEGKLYGLGYGYELHSSAGNGVTFPGVVFEYDPVSESITDVKSFAYAGGQPNSGVNPGFTQLLEVIPNEAPAISGTPATQTVCSGGTNSVAFTLTDADNDSITFTVVSSDTAVIPVAGISVSHAGTTYTLGYSAAVNMPGTVTVSVTADDGYGGTANFSFTVIVNALPNTGVTQSASTLTAQQSGATYQWIDCSSNTIVAGANGQSYTAAVSGTYAVIVTTGDCSDTSACIPVTAVGIHETASQNNGITLQPNPAADQLQVLITDNTKPNIIALKVKNILGEIVLGPKEINTPVNISMLVKGVYFITVETSDKTYTSKFIKQ